MKYISKVDEHVTHISEYLHESAEYNLIIIHGMSEHRDRYKNVSEEISKEKINVYTIDLRGHYQSLEKGPLGHFENYEYMAHDIEGIIQMIKKVNPLPTTLMGHSMGSLYARSYLKRYQDHSIDQLILMGSPYKPVGLKPLKALLSVLSKLKPKQKAQWIANATNKTFMKNIDNPKTELDWLSFDEENVKNYISDPYCNFPFTYCGYYNLFSLLDEVYNHTWENHPSNLPILFMIGKEDPCPDFERDGFNQAILKLKNVGYTNIDSIIYENSRHEILNDLDQHIAAKDIIQFIKK